MSDKATELFNQIVRPAMNDCSLSLSDYRIIQGAVMQALQAALRITPVDLAQSDGD